MAPKVRGFVNAVLRRVSEDVSTGGEWPSLGVEISYPDWLIDRLIDELGELEAIEALKAMNVGEQPKPRPDGPLQVQPRVPPLEPIIVVIGSGVLIW